MRNGGDREVEIIACDAAEYSDIAGMPETR